MESANDNQSIIEAIAYVVAVEGDRACFEPEPKKSCNSCTSLVCVSGTLSSQLAARRFTLPNDENFKIGERIVVGISENVLIKAALTVYAIPLFMMIIIAIGAQWLLASNLITLISSILGLGLGFIIARWQSKRIFSSTEITPVFIRRILHTDDYQQTSCHSK